MFKSVCLFLGCFVITLSCFAGAKPLDCQSSTNVEVNIKDLDKVAKVAAECPNPTRDEMVGVCEYVVEQTDPEGEELDYKYQEEMWKLSCATPGVDSKEVAKIKIQKMWLKNREAFRCYGMQRTVTVPNGNITKISMESNFPWFLLDSARTYQLDMNFIDPADGKTIMDFLKSKREELLRNDPKNTSKIAEYQRVYDILKAGGAKHAKDL